MQLHGGVRSLRLSERVIGAVPGELAVTKDRPVVDHVVEAIAGQQVGFEG